MGLQQNFGGTCSPGLIATLESPTISQILNVFFSVEEVEYLGDVSSIQSVHVYPMKIYEMKDQPHPNTLKYFQNFLNFTSYYRKFVQNYGKIATPFTTFLKKNDFTWIDEVE